MLRLRRVHPAGMCEPSHCRILFLGKCCWDSLKMHSSTSFYHRQVRQCLPFEAHRQFAQTLEGRSQTKARFVPELAGLDFVIHLRTTPGTGHRSESGRRRVPSSWISSFAGKETFTCEGPAAAAIAALREISVEAVIRTAKRRIGMYILACCCWFWFCCCDSSSYGGRDFRLSAPHSHE